MGTELEKVGLEMGGHNSATNPDAVLAVHKDYVEKGIDLLITNTLTMNRIYIEAHNVGVDVRDVNLGGAKLSMSMAKQFTLLSLFAWARSHLRTISKKSNFVSPHFQILVT